MNPAHQNAIREAADNWDRANPCKNIPDEVVVRLVRDATNFPWTEDSCKEIYLEVKASYNYLPNLQSEVVR
jgi:hypothetical protein